MHGREAIEFEGGNYYISEPIVTNDLKGVGAFILASIETDRLF